eukprot:SAG11_NODE_22499_length_405_cov_0.669935_1_plen_126_part_10
MASFSALGGALHLLQSDELAEDDVVALLARKQPLEVLNLAVTAEHLNLIRLLRLLVQALFHERNRAEFLRSLGLDDDLYEQQLPPANVSNVHLEALEVIENIHTLQTMRFDALEFCAATCQRLRTW